MRRAASRVLTAGQVRDLLAAAPPPDPEVSGAALARAYRLDDGGTLLVFEDGKGRRYESREALLAMMGAVAAQRVKSALATRLPEADFVAQAPALAASLGLAQLSDVDTFIVSSGVAQCSRAPLFGQLVAYVGEFIRERVGGAWHTELAADGATLEPWIVDASGRRHAPFALVLNELSEWGPESSLAGAVIGHLQSGRLR